MEMNLNKLCFPRGNLITILLGVDASLGDNEGAGEVGDDGVATV